MYINSIPIVCTHTLNTWDMHYDPLSDDSYGSYKKYFSLILNACQAKPTLARWSWM